MRYARKTSLKNYKRLSSEEYGENLMSFLDDSKSCSNLTMNDLKNVLHALSAPSPLNENQELSANSSCDTG